MKNSKKKDDFVKPSLKKKEAFIKRMKKLRGKVDLKEEITKEVKIPEPKSEIKDHKFYSSLVSNKVLVLLCKEKPFTITGAVDLQCFTENVEIFGYQSKLGEKVSLFNPNGFNTFSIEVVSSDQNTPNWSTLKDFTENDIEDCKEHFRPENGVIVLSRHSSHKVDFLKKIMKEHFFPSVHFLAIERNTYACEYLLNCSFEFNEYKTINISPFWKNVKLEKSSKVIVAGGQNVGKSTFLRYMVNNNLKKASEKILLIDLDIGQSEVFLPQTISATVLENPLLGPGYFHNLNPEEAVFVGEINVILSPENYLRSVIELIKRCRENPSLNGIPWVINTMGYFKGFGLELLLNLYKIIRPTDVVQINDRFEKSEGNQFQSSVVEKMIGSLPDFPAFQLHQFEKNFFTKKYRRNTISAKDIRHLVVMCGLSGVLKSGGGFLNDVTPVSAHMESLRIYNSTTQMYSSDFASINGCLVYLCKKGESSTSLSCLGVGIVRGIDDKTKKVYLLPSCSLNVLSKVNCLAMGTIVLPSALLINQGPNINKIPPFLYRTKEFTGSKSIQQMHHKVPTRKRNGF
ncbi:NOL9 family protein [Megaselia abdita]